MVVTLTVLEATTPRPEPCCSPGRCRFRVPLTRAWLYAALDARIHREPLADMIRDGVRSSADEDPWIRGARVDPDAARDIALSLERARDVGHLELSPRNAEAVAAFCCPFALGDS